MDAVTSFILGIFAVTFGLVLLGLAYEAVSAAWLYHKNARRWGK